MKDSERSDSDLTKSDGIDRTKKPGSSDEFEPTRILSDKPFASEMPETLPPSSQDSRPVKHHELLHYFGDYELLDEIARGGMGVIYKARQTRLKRDVAVKMILGGKLASETDVKRFLVEAGAAANLDHPGIVPVYEFGEHAGTHYFSMAFVDGPNLAQFSGEAPMTPSEAAELIRKIADAVAYAHQRGVVHRDLKPANVLIDHDGHPRITDFGLAKQTDTDDELTQDGTIMGSVYYMPPEQASGSSAAIGPAADVYSLGAILYKLLTGHPPFKAPTTLEILNQVIEQEPVSPRRVNPKIPKDLETICLKCLQKDPARRFHSADDLVSELERFQRGEPIRSRPISRWAYAARWCRRNPLPATLAAGLCATVLLSVVVATTFWNRAKSEQQRFVEQQRSVDVLSEMVLRKSLDETDEWLRLFFNPVEQQLRVTADWSREGVLDPDQPERVNGHLTPLIEHYDQISSLMLADDRGREHMLLGIRHEKDGILTRQWRCRQTRRDQWSDEVRWMEWTDRSQDVTRRTELLDYDPRTRPWFEAAVAGHGDAVATRPESTSPETNLPETAISQATLNEGGERDLATPQHIHWTEPYVFFTTKDLGITASFAVPHTPQDDVTSVVAFDVLLEDITRFTSTKHPTPNGKVCILTKDAKLVGLPSDHRSLSPADWKHLFLTPVSELGQPFGQEVDDAFSFNLRDGVQIRSFETGGDVWWGAARPFHLGEDLALWILVLLPESDLQESLSGDQ